MIGAATVRLAVAARVHANRDHSQTMREAVKKMLKPAKLKWCVHLSSIAGLLTRISGRYVTSAAAMAAVSEVFPYSVYASRSRYAPVGLRRHVVRGVRVRVAYSRLAPVIEGAIEKCSDPVYRNNDGMIENRAGVMSARLGDYRENCKWEDFPPLEKIIFEDWANTRRVPTALAKKHGQQVEIVRAILSRHRARAGVLAI